MDHKPVLIDPVRRFFEEQQAPWVVTDEQKVEEGEGDHQLAQYFAELEDPKYRYAIGLIGTDAIVVVDGANRLTPEPLCQLIELISGQSVEWSGSLLRWSDSLRQHEQLRYLVYMHGQLGESDEAQQLLQLIPPLREALFAVVESAELNYLPELTICEELVREPRVLSWSSMSSLLGYLSEFLPHVQVGLTPVLQLRLKQFLDQLEEKIPSLERKAIWEAEYEAHLKKLKWEYWGWVEELGTLPVVRSEQKILVPVFEPRLWNPLSDWSLEAGQVDSFQPDLTIARLRMVELATRFGGVVQYRLYPYFPPADLAWLPAYLPKEVQYLLVDETRSLLQELIIRMGDRFSRMLWINSMLFCGNPDPERMVPTWFLSQLQKKTGEDRPSMMLLMEGGAWWWVRDFNKIHFEDRFWPMMQGEGVDAEGSCRNQEKQVTEVWFSLMALTMLG